MFHRKSSSERRQPRSKAIFALGLIALAAASHAQVTKVAGGYLLRVQYTKGQVIRLASVNTVTSAKATKGETPMKVEMPIVMKIKAANQKEATAIVTIGPVMFGGSIFKEPETMELTFDRQNQAKSKDAPAFVGAQLPTKPIKIGQVWATVAPLPDISGGVRKMKAIYKFQGVRKVNGKDLAVLTYVLGGGANGSGTLSLLASDGTIYSNVANIKIGGPEGALNVVAKLDRK